MKRRNKSVQQARAAPARVVGGNDAIMNRYGEASSFKPAMGDYSYINAASTINTTKTGASMLSSR